MGEEEVFKLSYDIGPTLTKIKEFAKECYSKGLDKDDIQRLYSEVGAVERCYYNQSDFRRDLILLCLEIEANSCFLRGYRGDIRVGKL